MTLHLIGLGLSDEKDITLKGLETIQKCDKIYLENYTSLLQCSLTDLEKLYQKKIILADREKTEQQFAEILKEAKTKDIAFLVVGDPFSATTHAELFKEAREKKIPVKVIHNASILTAVGISGLQLYKFGKTTSIPFLDNYNRLETPYNILRENQYLDMHTLFLLDLKPEEQKFMTVNQALDLLETIEKRKKEKVIRKGMMVIGCARLGSDNYLIKSGAIEKIKKMDFGNPPHCLIIPSKKLHFAEEEMIRRWE